MSIPESAVVTLHLHYRAVQLHIKLEPSSSCIHKENARAMPDKIEEGTVRRIGFSTSDAQMLCHYIWRAAVGEFI